MINVFIEETLCRCIPVDAKDDAEAMEKVEKMYRNGDIVLTADDFTGCYQISTADTDWVEGCINGSIEREDRA